MRSKLKIRHIILGILAALLVAGILYLALLSSRAHRRLEALRAAGQPTSLAELALQNRLPMGVENAAPIYRSAFAVYVAPADDTNVPYLTRKYAAPHRGVPLSEPVAQAIADCLAANEQCLVLLHEAATIQTCRYDYDYEREYPPLSELRHCALLCKTATVYYANEGDPNAVVACVRDMLHIGDSLQNEPLLITHLVHMGCIGAAVTGLEQALSLTTFTDSQLKDLYAAFAEAGGKIDLVWAMTTERCLTLDCVRDPSRAEIEGLPAMILKLPGIQSQGIIDVVDYMNACVEAAALPPVQRAERSQELDAFLSRDSIRHLAAGMLLPALSRSMEVDSRTHAHLSLVTTALAIERYRLAEGKLPQQLTDLVPKYLEQVPDDPFDGRPIRYRRTEPGYVLWSVTDDRQDNGGKEKNEVARGEPYDLCFIVTR